jgi:pyridoxal phosphate enzyme (YggS family)
MNALLDLGILDIGENRVQEWMEKRERVDSRFRLHQIGRLQTNKVKYIVPGAYMIQSVDRLPLLFEIAKRSAGSPVNILLQVNTAREPQKAGVLPEELPRLFDEAIRCPGICLRGLMCIAPLEGGRQAAGDAFTQAKALYDRCRSIASVHAFDTLSMGMWEILNWLRVRANTIRLGFTFSYEFRRL